MTNIFISILTTSLQATIVAAIVILAKKVLAPKLNTRAGYFLWILVLFRLVIPVLPVSPISIFNIIDFDFKNKIIQSNDMILFERANEMDANAVTYPDNNEKDFKAVDGKTGAAVISQKPSTPPSPTKLFSAEFVSVVSYIWGIGSITIIIYLFLANIIFALRIKKMTHITLQEAFIEQLKSVTKIRRCTIAFVEGEDITSPSVFGFINYTVLLPKGFMKRIDKKIACHMLMHEFAHIKHGDLVVCWLFSIICAIHWFNPMIWYILKYIKRDQELCADAYTMSLIEEEDVQDYGQTLLSIVTSGEKKSPVLITAGITENKNTLKQRIINIATFSKNKYRLTFISIFLIAMAGIFLCTSQMNYPKTAEERMNFDDNIIMNFNLKNMYNPKSFELQISNNNKTAIHTCELEIYSGNPFKADGELIYSRKDFKIAGKKFNLFKLDNIDYNNAYVKFNYKFGFAFNDSNKSWRSGDLRAIDDTLRAKEWSPVSDEEIDIFIQDNNINAIAINRIYNFYTIVIFDNGNSSGYYELYKDDRYSDLRSRRIIGFSYSSNFNRLPVRMMGGSASGDYPFVNFKINSPSLKALGDRIEIQTANGTITTPVSRTSAYTVPTRGYGRVNNILIYDKNDRMIFDGKKLLLEDVEFKPDDTSYLNITGEKGFKIAGQLPVSHEINFTPGMFPEDYVAANKSQDIDWKIPLFTYENTTVYLRSIVESNESPEYLYAWVYFVHDVNKTSGKILSSVTVNFQEGTLHSYSSNVYPRLDASTTVKTLENTVSLRGSGPGDQIAMYLEKSMVEKTKGKFTVILEGLNLISYIPK